MSDIDTIKSKLKQCEERTRLYHSVDIEIHSDENETTYAVYIPDSDTVPVFRDYKELINHLDTIIGGQDSIYNK